MSQTDFLSKLENEASRQAKLYSNRVFPSQLDWLTSLVGRYPWQVVLICSGITAIVLSGVSK